MQKEMWVIEIKNKQYLIVIDWNESTATLRLIWLKCFIVWQFFIVYLLFVAH